MFTAALLTTALETAKCPITDEWSLKMWYKCTVEHIRKNEIMLFAGKWMELENIMLSKTKEAQKDKTCMFSLICGSK
jgi:hypothetical protein